MRGLLLTWALILTAALAACDGERGTEQLGADGPASSTTGSVADQAVAADQAKQEELSGRLMALDFFSEQMWTDHEGDAGLDWLKTSAASRGLELARVMPEVLIEREGVAVRPVTLEAQGQWGPLVGWLGEIEASPRRLILREMKLQTLRNRVVAQVKLAVLIDRPTGLAALAELDVAALRGDELDRAVGLIETELRGKSQAFEQLGADASWSRPIADLTALMPEGARPISLGVGRYTNGQRAQSFNGSFTLLIPDAGEVPGYVRQLQKHDGFASAGLRSLRRAGADWQRATVTFSFTGDKADGDTLPAEFAAAAAPVSQ